MYCNVNRLRQPFNPYAIPELAAALHFMNDVGRACYGDEIEQLRDRFNEMQAEAGPGGPDCPVTQEILDQIDSEIEAVAEAALERYRDWATD